MEFGVNLLYDELDDNVDSLRETAKDLLADIIIESNGIVDTKDGDIETE